MNTRTAKVFAAKVFRDEHKNWREEVKALEESDHVSTGFLPIKSLCHESNCGTRHI